MSRLQLQNLKKSFDDTEVIKDVSLDIASGEFVVFVGPSGCGKSTMLRMIAGLEEASSGKISIDERDVTDVAPAKRGVAMVFQSYALFPHMTVAENIGFGLKLSKTPKDEINRRVREVAQTLKIEDLLERTPRQLSGGQRQRVAIGRSIIRDPKAFLFDEPLSNLDAALRVQMRLEIARLHARLDATMIYVTHDQTEAMTLADRIVVFNSGQIEQVGTPTSIYAKPANMFVAGFIGAPAMNFMPASVTSDQGQAALRIGDVSIRLDGQKQGLANVATCGIRPEHLAVAAESDGDFKAEIEIVEELGGEKLLYLQTNFLDTPLTVRTQECNSKKGEQVSVKMDRRNIHLFDKQGQAN